MEDSGVTLHDIYGFAYGWAYEGGVVWLAAGCLGVQKDYLCRLFVG